MLAELAELHPQVRDTFAEASEGAGVDLWALSQGGPEEQLNRTEYTQPALLAAGIAVWRLWNAQGGARPALVAGHSLGEYTALVAAGALSLRDGAHLVRLRGQLMQEAAPAGVGAMAAVLGSEDALVQEVCVQASGSQVVVPANFNSPGQIVIGGDAGAVDRALALLAEKGVRKAVKLAVSVPSHTPLMREAANRLAEAMAGLDWRMPALPVVQNVDAQAHASIDAIRDALVRQLYLPVQWTGCVQALAARGIGFVRARVGDRRAAGFGHQADVGAAAHRLEPGADLGGVGLVAERVDGDFLQRPGGAHQLEEGARRLGVLGDVGVQAAGPGARVGGQPAFRGGLAQPHGDQVQRAAHAGAPGAASGSSPNPASMVVRAISGRPMMAVGSSLWMLSIRAMPRLSALALPAVS